MKRVSRALSRMSTSRTSARATILAAVTVLVAAFASAGVASAEVPVTQTSMPGFEAPETPASLNQVGVIKIGSPQAKNVLVLEPGTSAGAGYFVPFAKWLVEHTTGWQVWSVERRQNLLEDQSVLNKAKRGEVTPQELYNYYLGYLVNPSIKPHFEPVPDSSVPFARQWGMNVAVEDLHRVIEAAKALHGSVVLGGHSLGGSVVTAYATWNFSGKPGAVGLRGLVYDDGGSSSTPVSATKAEESLEKLSKKTPWLAFGGIPTPFLGLFSALGSTLTVVDPKGPALLQPPILPSILECSIPPFASKFVPCTNEAGFGYSVNVGSSPPNLKAAQIHGGKGVEEVAEADGLHGWNGEGALTPVQRYAEMLSGTGLTSADGSEWYFPERLTIDTGAVGNGNANAAQSVLNVHSTEGSNLPKTLKMYAIATELGKQGVLTSAETLAKQSGIPSNNLTLLNEETTYAHNDPAGAYPNNEFFNNLVPFLEGLHTISGTVSGPLVVKSGESVELTSTGKISGPVTVEPGGSLDIEGGTVSGPIKANGAAQLRMCGASVSGPVEAINGSNSVVIGEGTSGCSANTITGPVTVMGNKEGVLIDGNVVSGPLKVTGNEGGTTVTSNTVSGPLTVTGNGAPVVDKPNKVSGPSTLQ